MKITYEEFKRVNNTTKTRFNHTVWSGSIIQIVGVQFSKGLCQIKHMDQEKIYEETIQNIVSMILKGHICVNNPSALKEWKGFVNESNISNVEKKTKLQTALIEAIRDDLSDSFATFEAVCVLKLGLDGEDLGRMRTGKMPKYNQALYNNCIKYVLACNSKVVNQKLIRQGIVLA